MDDIYCPYCDAGQDINHDDGYGYEEDRVYQQQCGVCDKNFTFTTSISFYYEAEKADCLNGIDHNYLPVATTPKEYTRMRCDMCYDERFPTQEEKERYGIPEKPSPKKIIL